VPRISSFYGIVIRMFYDEARHEGRPHFHAAYGGDEAVFDIESLELIAGKLSRRAKKLVLEWARAHQEELRENWDLARAYKQPKPIDPLS
jgi:uncharacterized protein DUF4160